MAEEKPITKLYATTRDHIGNLPIHIALWHAEPAKAIAALLAAAPDTAKEADPQGWLPLHIAAQSQARPDVIVALLRAYRGAAAERCPGQQVALHIATSFQLPKPSLAELLRVHLDGAEAKDEFGKTPLDYDRAFGSGAPLKNLLEDRVVLEAALDADWEGVEEALHARPGGAQWAKSEKHEVSEFQL